MMDSDAESHDTTEFYALLNLARDASQEEVTKSYRRLAQVFHPDKHLDAAKRQQAQASFSRIQEAYEVLSDPHKRQVYDVYGKQGLAAGLEVGEHLRSRDALKAEWEAFMGKAARDKEEAAVVQKGSYQAKVDLRPVLAGQGLPGVTRPGPLFKSVAAQSALEAVVGEHNVLSLSGHAAVRPAYRRTPHGLEEMTIGGGNVVFGYKRIISEEDVLDVSGQLGLQSLLSVTSTRRIDRACARDAWLSSSWGPQQGLGLQVGCSQNLAWGMTGSCNAVLGPEGATGIATTLVKRGKAWSAQLRLEVGAVTAVQGRLNVMVAQGLTLRAIARLGTTGIDLELGAAHKFSPQLSGYVGGCVGLPAGVQVKVRMTRANQSFECPILLSSSARDWQLAAIAYVAPPLVFWVVHRSVVRPALAWAKAARERTHRNQVADSVRAALAKALAEQELISGAAARKAASEAAVPGQAGLVIEQAVYGLLDEWRAHHAAGAPQDGASAACAPASPPASGQGGVPATAAPQPAASPPAPASAPGQAPGSPPGPSQAPASWLDVTGPVQYLVQGSSLTLADCAPRSQLMGFADPAPHRADKQLYVRYRHKGAVHSVVVGDFEELVLPVQPQALADG